MFGWITRFSLQFRILVLALAAGIIAFGIMNVPRIAVDTMPEFAPAQVEIQTEALGLSAVEVEQLITSPMEADLLNGVAWLDEIRSKSVPGLSSIELVFEPGTDLLRARQLVAERMTQAHALPNVSTPPLIMQPVSSTSRVLMVKMNSKQLSGIEMSVLARWKIKPRLIGIPGVANVSIWGQREQQLQVEVTPTQLRDKGITLEQVIKTTGNAVWVSPLSFLEASTPGTGGFVESPSQRLGIQHVLPIRTPADLSKVSVEDSTPAMLLGDIAQVREDHQPLIGDAVVGQDAGLMLVIEKFPGTSTVQVTEDIEAALKDMEPGLTGVQLDTTVFRPATAVQDSVTGLGLALLISLLIAVGLFWLLFRSWRVAVIALAAITTTVVTAAVVLYAQNATLNVTVLFGLVLGMSVIVGDIVEDVQAQRRRPLVHRGHGNRGHTEVADRQGRPERPDPVVPGLAHHGGRPHSDAVRDRGRRLLLHSPVLVTGAGSRGRAARRTLGHPGARADAAAPRDGAAQGAGCRRTCPGVLRSGTLGRPFPPDGQPGRCCGRWGAWHCGRIPADRQPAGGSDLAGQDPAGSVGFHGRRVQ